MKTIVTLALLCLSITVGTSQGILDQYVQQAIDQNLSVREKQLIEKQYDFRIKEAGKQFGPEVNFMANYTLAAGGRNIEFPVGTLLNPVYAKLNMITESNDFPMVEDQSINFLRLHPSQVCCFYIHDQFANGLICL